MLKELDITPQDEILIHNCNIGQLQSLFDCESCPYIVHCTNFMQKHECVPTQAIYSKIKHSYIADVGNN